MLYSAELRRALVFVLLLGVAASPAFAQIGTSTITGRVTDASGAVLPNATVTVVQENTNFKFNAVSNNEGIYHVLSLQPGLYTLTFELQGFKKLVREKLDLRSNTTQEVDAELQVGELGQSVEVTSETPLLETQTSATGATVEGDFLYKMPLYQRYINSTLNIVPGMTSGGYAYGGDLGAYHLAGQRNGSIGIFEDGVLGNDQQGGQGTIKPVQNAVEEVKVLTTTLPAEYGHSAGGVISVVKKTGTNDFHGMVSGYGRARPMQHRLYFDKFKTSQPTATRPDGVPTFFLQPDMNVSGPIYIPKAYNGKNKTFFFYGFQWLIEKKIAQDYFGAVPTAAMKGGDFNFPGVATSNPIYDPATTRLNPAFNSGQPVSAANPQWLRDPFPGNKIPLERLDPVARKILGLNPWADPNQAGSYNAAGPSANFYYDEFSRTFFKDHNVRIDHQFSSNVKLYGSYTVNYQSGYGRPRNITIADFDGLEGNYQPFEQHNISVGNTWVLNPTTVNDVRVGYYRRRNDKTVPSSGKDWAKQLGIPNVSADMMPGFGADPGGQNFSGVFSPETIYGIGTVTGPNRTIGETLSFRNDLSKTRGTHAFKMGYEWLQFRVNSQDSLTPSGQFRFDGMTAGLQPNGTTVPNTGNTFAGFLLGYVRQAQFRKELASWQPRSDIHSFYFQDDWKFSPNLTLNLGVRYSNEGPFSTKYELMSNFDPNVTDTVTGLKGGLIHPTGSLNHRDNNNFQPRIGLAWNPSKKWVFRGGFAINTVDVKFPQSRGQFEEYSGQVTLEPAPGNPSPLFRISQGPPPVAYPIRPDGTSGFVGTNYGSRSSEWWDPNLRNPYVVNWHSSVQYELSTNYLLEVSYQASAGNGLVERWQANTFPLDYAANDPILRNQVFAAPQNYRPWTHFGDVRFRSNFGHSTFHSGTIKLEKRLSQGLTFTNFYTFSKAIDSQDGDNDGTGVMPIQNRSLEKARSGFDRNHRYIAAVNYQLPWGKDRKWMNSGGWKDKVLGGYELSWIQTIESGNPLTFSFAGSPNNYYPTFAGNRRPNVVGDPKLRDNWIDLGTDRFTKANMNPIIDINYFAYPAAFTAGNSGRNNVTGTRLLWSQVSAQKNIPINEKLRFQIRWDFQNALKTFNFNPPDTTVNFNTPKEFGKVTSDPRTASLGGQPLMNLTLALFW